MNKINSNDLQQFIFENFGVMIDIKPNLIFLHIENNDLGLTQITLIDDSILTTLDDIIQNNKLKIFSTGIEILRISKNDKLLLPPLMYYLSVDQELELSSEKIFKKITKNQSVESNIFSRLKDGELLILNNNTPISYGSVIESKFTPLIDIGLYLRSVE
jgi:hypothetical protein